ncbi:MAG: iron donor protein CyaY [Planctomycetes bacterium]|nr:iron donor protein CyaY [Planctomycetota bacterium]
MQPNEYLRQVDTVLARVQRWLEGFDPDELDYSTTDGVITIEFADRTRYVLNRQTAASQMWLAAGARAWHYSWDAAKSEWLDDRDGHRLLENVARVVSTKLGRDVKL